MPILFTTGMMIGASSSTAAVVSIKHPIRRKMITHIKITTITLEFSAIRCMAEAIIWGSPSLVMIQENMLADVIMINSGPHASAVSLHVSHRFLMVTFL